MGSVPTQSYLSNLNDRKQSKPVAIGHHEKKKKDANSSSSEEEDLQDLQFGSWDDINEEKKSLLIIPKRRKSSGSKFDEEISELQDINDLPKDKKSSSKPLAFSLPITVTTTSTTPTSQPKLFRAAAELLEDNADEEISTTQDSQSPRQ